MCIRDRDATRKLVQAVLAEGAGGKYLIQHSAGSGKTNSIAWTAHFLADLHNDVQQKMFDSVLVAVSYTHQIMQLPARALICWIRFTRAKSDRLGIAILCW